MTFEYHQDSDMFYIEIKLLELKSKTQANKLI